MHLCEVPDPGCAVVCNRGDGLAGWREINSAHIVCWQIVAVGGTAHGLPSDPGARVLRLASFIAEVSVSCPRRDLNVSAGRIPQPH
jgi:hypothetical protein